MTTSFIVQQNRQTHLHHLRENIERLRAASSSWSPADRTRGFMTIHNLERQIESIKAELFRVA